MASLLKIVDAITGRLAVVDELREFAEPPQGALPPLAFPIVQGWEALAMGKTGLIQVDLEVVILTSETVRPQDGYRNLLRFVDHTGPASVFLALWDGNDTPAGTFGGLADTQLDTSSPGSFRVLGVEEMDAYQMYGGAIAVRVLTRG